VFHAVFGCSVRNLFLALFAIRDHRARTNWTFLRIFGDSENEGDVARNLKYERPQKSRIGKGTSQGFGCR
jgi:hypothetical protein